MKIIVDGLAIFNYFAPVTATKGQTNQPTNQTKTMKRTTNLIQFAKLLDEKIDAIREETNSCARIYQINSPVAKGDVEIVIEDKSWDHRKAFTYRADGTFSNLSYWIEGQI